MATGTRPFRGETCGSVNAILGEVPTSPAQLNPQVPFKLEEIITKCLEKDRELRYHHASDLRTDLQRLKRDRDTRRPVFAQKASSSPSTSAGTSPMASVNASTDTQEWQGAACETSVLKRRRCDRTAVGHWLWDVPPAFATFSLDHRFCCRAALHQRGRGCQHRIL